MAELLDVFPRLRIGAFPTPYEELTQLSRELGCSIWCKRDNQSSTLYGGNKVRKLEFLLGDARTSGCDTLITVGAVGSHHVFATSVHGRAQGFEVHALLGPQPDSAHARKMARVQSASGAKLYPCRSYAQVAADLARVSLGLKRDGRRTHLIVPGGSSPTGVLGYVAAALEYAEAVGRGDAPKVDAIYVALGTCGTAAGLALGLVLGGLPIPVISVRVTDPPLGTAAAVWALLHTTVGLLERSLPKGAVPADLATEAQKLVRIDADELGRGYGYATPAAVAAIERARGAEGLELDPTYTGKAFAALLRDAASAKRYASVLYWHTLSSADLAPWLSTQSDVPDALRPLLTPES